MDKLTRKLAPNINLVTEFASAGIESEVGTELYVYLEDDDGIVIQDLGIFRNANTSGENEYPRKFDGTVQVLLYTDENDEDYTHDFTIPVCEVP